MKKNNDKASLWLRVITGLLTAAVLVLAVLSIVNMARDSRADALRQLETSIRRCVMACYADEGVYPENLEYLQQHYGLQIDETRYEVHYSVIAENIMPDITVIERAE